jgi:predicted phosphodiesterase
MAVLIVGDVHSNLAALDAVLRDAEARATVDAVWSLGDAVGYGPDPDAVLDALRGQRLIAVAGNHDLAACGKTGVHEFNDAAAAAALWTRDTMRPDSADFLRNLPMSATAGEFTLVHGSLRQPEWEYLLSAEQALVQFELQPTPYSIVGHSHLPFVMEEAPGAPPRIRPADDGDTLALGAARLILNPGSAGQPRDGDPRVSYMLYDEAAATVSWHRVEYDIARTQSRMVKAGLPLWLSERLSVGR